MGKNVTAQFEECLRTRKIKAAADLSNLAEKELRVAERDLNDAKAGLEQSRWKWSTIQAYYVMFHAARALLFLMKRTFPRLVREKSSRAPRHSWHLQRV